MSNRRQILRPNIESDFQVLQKPWRDVCENEAEKTQAAVSKVIGNSDGQRNSEEEKVLKRLGGQIGKAISVWTEKHVILDASVKDYLMEEGRKWLDSLSPRILNGLLTLCPETARFVVVSNLSVSQQLQLIGGTNWWPEGWNDAQVPKWRFGITDGRENIPFDPTIFYEHSDEPEDKRKPRTNEAMVAEYASRFAEIGLALMPQHAYMPSAINALAREKVIDRGCFTSFKRNPGAGALPYGGWFRYRVGLGGDIPDNSYKDLRCRPWVEREIPSLVLAHKTYF